MNIIPVHPADVLADPKAPHGVDAVSGRRTLGRRVPPSRRTLGRRVAPSRRTLGVRKY